MPLFTPSRVAVVVITLSLISFLWTFGLPRPLAEPSRIIGHDEVKLTTHTLQTTPTPTLHVDDHRWDDKTVISTAGLETSHDGRSKDKVTSTKSQKATTTPTTTTLLKTTPTPVLGPCRDVRNAAHVMVVVKTSKAETSKLSAHLLGLLSCVPNFAIFSDHAGEIDGVRIHDALHNVSSEAKQKHEEFREYSIIKADAEYKPDTQKTRDLDKWKILPMVYQAYLMNPHARFYVFIEADTGLSWTNLLQWVDRLDYRIPYYSGAQSFLNHVQFAQRGSGILLSQGALRRYGKSYEERYAGEWEARVGKECCGDMVLATALNDAHVELYTSWPLIQGEQPNTLDYTPKQWCVPAVSWHHMDGEALGKNWDLQKNWTEVHGWEKPYLYRDAFDEYVRPHLTAQKENWDNLGSDTKIIAPQGRQKQMEGDDERRAKERLEKGDDERQQKVDDTKPAKEEAKKAEDVKSAKEKLQKAASSFDRRDDKKDNKKDKESVDWDKIGTMVKDGADNPESCKRVCTEVDDCLQWRHTVQGDGECHLSKVIKLGKATEKKDGVQQWTSGWMVNRIQNVTKGWECKEANWKFYQ